MFNIDKIKIYGDDKRDTMMTLGEYGVVILPDFFTEKQILNLDSELCAIYDKLAPKDTLYFDSPNHQHVQKNSYVAGKVIRISPNAYINFPVLSSLFAKNEWLNSIVDLYYGTPNKKSMQTFATHDFIKRNEEWIDGINHNGGLHFDPWQALKFSTYITGATKETGATRIIPGSQPEGQYLRTRVLKETIYNNEPTYNTHELFKLSKYQAEDSIYLEVNPGDLVIFDTDLWHGGGEILEENKERKFVVCHNRKY